MFDDNDDFSKVKLNIDSRFAKKFEIRKERELLQDSKHKYGKNLESTQNIFTELKTDCDELEMLNEDDADETSESEEDENAELLNENVSSKFISTLAKIRCKDPEIYDKKEDLFKGI